MGKTLRKPPSSKPPREPGWRRTNMAHWRKMRGLTQEDVAEKLHVTHATVGRWESGDIDPGGSTLEQLAILYETDIHSMLNRLPVANGRDVPAERDDPICQLAKRISDQQRVIVLALLKDMAG